MSLRTLRNHLDLTAFRKTVANDLSLLVRLHDRELDALAVEMLRARRFPAGLGLAPQSLQGRSAIAMLEQVETDLSAAPADLAALSDVYCLLYRSPEDICASGRLKRSGDDMVVHLTVVAQLIGSDGGQGTLVETTRYIDRHLSGSLHSFADWTESRCPQSFYAGLAQLTDGYIRELRKMLCDISEAEVGSAYLRAPAGTNVACS